MTDNAIAQHVVDAALKLHTHLGPGLLENVYVAVLAAELGRRGFGVRTQVPLPVVCEDVMLDVGYRIDLIVAERVIVEVKSIEALADVHFKQPLTYLRLSDKRLGLLINSNASVLKGNVKRSSTAWKSDPHPEQRTRSMPRLACRAGVLWRRSGI